MDVYRGGGRDESLQARTGGQRSRRRPAQSRHHHIGTFLLTRVLLATKIIPAAADLF